MQTLQNVGALTASLGPMAGGYGYAGATPTYNTNYLPKGVMGRGNFANTGYNQNAGLPGIYNNMGTSQGTNSYKQPQQNNFSPQAINPMIT